MYSKQAVDMTTNDQIWRKVDLSTVPGMENLDIHMHVNCCTVAEKLNQFFFFVSKFFMGLGGALPLIIHDQLSDLNWKEELEQAVHNPLDKERLSALTDCIKGVPIYLFGQCDEVKHIDASCEGNMTLTLTPEDFTDPADKPNIQNTRMLIFIQRLEVAVGCSSNHWGQLSAVEALCIFGRARDFVHELTHGIRLHMKLSKLLLDLAWIRSDCGDWCIRIKDAVEKIAIPPKYAEHSIGQRANNIFCADAGRTWEHSVTQGKAIFEGDIRIFVALKRTDGPTLDLIGLWLLAKDILDAIEEPHKLIEISRRQADLFFAKKDPDGNRTARYVCNSDALVVCQFHCQSSLAWRANQILLNMA